METEIKVGQMWYDGSIFRQVNRVENEVVHYFFGRTIEEIESGRYPMTFCECVVFLKDNNLYKEEAKEEQFKFQVGDVVKVPWLKGEHTLISDGSNTYPITLLDNDNDFFTEYGFFDIDHELPVLTLVRRPKKEMTFERIKSEGINKLKCGSDIRHVIGFSPVDGLLITVLDVGGGTGAWAETEIKNWEAVL